MKKIKGIEKREEGKLMSDRGMATNAIWRGLKVKERGRGKRE